MLAPLKLTQRFTVSGDSMLPLLEPGDEVWVRAGAAEASPGDLLVFARFKGRDPSLVVHRLSADGLTRGDACLAADPPREKRDCLGRVVALRRRGKLLSLDSPAGAAWDGFCRLYAAVFLRFWREGPLDWLERRGFGGAARLLRGAALAPARGLGALLPGP